MLLQRSGPTLVAGRIYQCSFCVKRYKNKSPDHWANKLKKTNPANLALKHFDEFYRKLFKQDWPSVRIALLTQHKYVAVVNNFGDTEKTVELLENLGALSVQNVYNIHKERIEENDERKKINKNEKYKKNVLKMTQTIEDISNSRTDQSADPRENNKNDPSESKERQQKSDVEDGSVDTTTKSSTNIHTGKQSLHESIGQAELDQDRIIDAKMSGGEALFDFVPATKLKGMEDFITDSDYGEYYRPSPDVNFNVVPESELNISPYLHVYSFPLGDISEFPSPRRGVTGVFNYYCMDGGSLLPVLALDIQPFDNVLDMCAAPGGKTYLALQTLYPEVIVANDISRSRRLIEVMNQYIYDFNPRTDKRIRITNREGTTIDEENTYDKILVDVPCTNDRLSVMDDFNNVFNPMKLKYRLTLPELQASLLIHALKLVKVGGSVVYSTCSLSPIQNDGVVHMALKHIWEETQIQLEIKDLYSALKPLQSLYAFAKIPLSYGHLVRPYLPSNFGPMYFCKFDKIK